MHALYNLIQIDTKATEWKLKKKTTIEQKKKKYEKKIFSSFSLPSIRNHHDRHNCILLTRSTKFHLFAALRFNSYLFFPLHVNVILCLICVEKKKFEHAKSFCINHAIALAWESIHLWNRMCVCVRAHFSIKHFIRRKREKQLIALNYNFFFV